MDDDAAMAVNDVVRLLAMRHRARAGVLLGTLGLNIGQEVLLFELDTVGPQTQAQLAAAAHCEPPTITMAVRKLEAAGLVSRVRSATDNRAIVVSLTAAGQSLMLPLHRTWRQLAEETAGHLTDTERTHLVRRLREVSTRLQPSPERGEG